MIGARLLEVYETDPAQALELARAIGGEVERLLLAMDRAYRISDEIEDYAETNYGSSWEILAERYREWHDSPAVPICRLLLDGVNYWGEQYSDAAYDLGRLEAV